MKSKPVQFKSLAVQAGVCLLFALCVGIVFSMISSHRANQLRRLQEEALQLIESKPAWYLRGSPKTKEEAEEIERMQQEAEKISDKVNALQQQSESIEPFIFEKFYKSHVMFWFGCQVGLLIAAIWPISMCSRGLFRGQLESATLILACILTGGMIWQACSAYSTLAAGQPNERLYESFIGVIKGLVAGAGIGCLLAASFWFHGRNTTSGS